MRITIDEIERSCYNTGMAKYTPKSSYQLLEIKDNGDEVRLYENGDKRNQLGQIVEYGGQGKLITAETSRDYAQRRKAKILREIEAKLTDITKTNAPAEAIAAIVGKRAEIAMKDTTRTGNEAAKIVLSAVDAYQTKAEEHTQVIQHEYTVDDETRALLHAMIQERRDTHTDAGNIE